MTPWGESRVRQSGRRGKTTVPPMAMPGATPGPPPPPPPAPAPKPPSPPPQPSADVASASDHRPWPTSASGRSTDSAPADPVSKVDWPPSQKAPSWLPGRVEPVSLRPTSGAGGTTSTTPASDASTAPTRSPSFSRGMSWGPSTSSPTEPWLPTKISSNAVDEPNPQGLGIAGGDGSSNGLANYRGNGAAAVATSGTILSLAYGVICVRLMFAA